MGWAKFRQQFYAPAATLGASTIGSTEIADDAVLARHITDANVTVAKANTALKTKVDTVLIGDIAATDQKFIFAAAANCSVADIGYIVDTAIATAVVGCWKFNVVNMTSGSSLMDSTAIAAAATNAKNIAKDTLISLGLSDALALTANDVLELQITASGTPTTNISTMAVVTEFY